MSGGNLMSLGLRALTANYMALQTTGHNIANANVAGYSRQTVELATAAGQFNGAGFVGKGVDVATIARAHDMFLTLQASAARSVSAMDAARLTQLQRLETLFPTGELGLGHAASEFLNAMVDVANRPDDPAARQVALARAGDLAGRFAATGAELDAMQQGVREALGASVAEINDIARALAAANNRIAELKGLGQPPNDLLDERDRLLSRLSELVSVTRMEAADGTMSVFIAGGQSLVLGTRAVTLEVTADPADPMRATVAMVDGSARRLLGDSLLGGGSVAGLLRFQNGDLVDARNRVGQMAVALLGAVNAQQALGVTLQPPLGSVAGSALFAIGAPRVQAHASNSTSANPVTLTIVDGTALQPSDYDLQPDPASPGRYLLTRLRDGVQRSIASGDVVDGMRVDVGAPPPAAGDRFLLQPVGRAANGATRLLDDPRDLAAASPLIAQTDPANTGTAAVGSLAMTTSPMPYAGATARIAFTDDAGAYDWELRDGGGALLASGSGVWTPDATIPAPPADINGFAMRLTGVPRNGDVLTVAPTPATAIASNNGNALALLALRDAALVDGKTVTDAYAQALADVGVRVHGARSGAEISSAMTATVERSRSAVAGVNLDEEAARLIQYQQSYQAAAKILQVAQSLFETVLDAAGSR